MPAAAQSPAAASPVAPAPQPAAKAPAASAKEIIVPTGTRVSLVLENAISTKTAKPGDPVYFQTIFPVLVGNWIVMPAGTYVSGEMVQAAWPGETPGRVATEAAVDDPAERLCSESRSQPNRRRGGRE
jgi:hypothetical protein